LLILVILTIASLIVWKTKRCQSQAYQCRAKYTAQLSPQLAVDQQATAQQTIAVACEPDSYSCRLLSAANLPTLLLVLIGFGGIWAALRTLNAIEKQADAMMDADCALFLVEWEGMIHLNPEAPNGTLSHAIRWNVKNIGKSPGFITRAFSRFVIVKNLKELPAEPNYAMPVSDKFGYNSEPILVGGSPHRGYYAPLESSLSYQQIETEYKAGEYLLYAYGFIKYSDVYGREHESRFGVVWKRNMHLLGGWGFEIDGPKTYNRYKDPKKRHPN
jgi:hypothetical protein